MGLSGIGVTYLPRDSGSAGSTQLGLTVFFNSFSGRNLGKGLIQLSLCSIIGNK